MSDAYEAGQAGREHLPSPASLVKATVLAIAIALVLLVTWILPAEYGLDPTGVGGAMGLLTLNAADTDVDMAGYQGPESSASLGSVGPVWRSQAGFREDSDEVTLGPNEGIEVKLSMQEGDRFVFSWKTDGGSISFDMHGEEFDATDEFSSYWRGRNQSSAHGYFEAPFDGTHGWYWQNDGDEPVTVRVETRGFYDEMRQP